MERLGGRILLIVVSRSMCFYYKNIPGPVRVLDSSPDLTLNFLYSDLAQTNGFESDLVSDSDAQRLFGFSLDWST